MNKITREQAFALVDHAANTDMLYHYNGAYAYIRATPQSNMLLIVDTASEQPLVEAFDGSDYFETNKDYNYSQSAQIRNNGPLVEWWNNCMKAIA